MTQITRTVVLCVVIMNILSLVPVNAEVLIQEILVNPDRNQQAEAVLLVNTGTSSVSIASWRVATGTTPHDAVIPVNTTLCSRCSYLIADPSSREANFSWQDPDLVETITLVNDHSAVALHDENGTVRDTVCWGDELLIPDSFACAGALDTPNQGMSYRRIAQTGNSKHDFVLEQARFVVHKSILDDVELVVPLGRIFNVSVQDDDTSTPGMQWVPQVGTVRYMNWTVVSPEEEVLITFAGTEYAGTPRDMNTTSIITGKIPLDTSLPAGHYNITVHTAEQWYVYPVEIIPVESVSIREYAIETNKTVTVRVMLKNDGNTDPEITVMCGPLVRDDVEISLSWDCVHPSGTPLTQLGFASSQEVVCSSVYPPLATPGLYRMNVSVASLS